MKEFNQETEYVIVDLQCLTLPEIVGTAKFLCKINNDTYYNNLFLITPLKGINNQYTVLCDDSGSLECFVIEEKPLNWWMNMYKSYIDGAFIFGTPYQSLLPEGNINGRYEEKELIKHIKLDIEFV